MFKSFELTELNKNYKRSKPKVLRVLDFLFYAFLFVSVIYLLFCLTFVQARVIGPSMQPTFNKNLSYSEDAESSIYQDIVYANKLDKGSNGDIVLLAVDNEIIIKRVVATQGQVVILKKQSDRYFYYFVGDTYQSAKQVDERYILNRQDMNLSYFNSFCFDDPDLQVRKNINVIENDKEAYLIVREGCSFVVGDNRLVSRDSTSFGCVKNDSILGKVAFYYEYNQTFLGFIWQQICSIF